MRWQKTGCASLAVSSSSWTADPLNFSVSNYFKRDLRHSWFSKDLNWIDGWWSLPDTAWNASIRETQNSWKHPLFKKNLTRTFSAASPQFCSSFGQRLVGRGDTCSTGPVHLWKLLSFLWLWAQILSSRNDAPRMQTFFPEPFLRRESGPCGFPFTSSTDLYVFTCAQINHFSGSFFASFHIYALSNPFVMPHSPPIGK